MAAVDHRLKQALLQHGGVVRRADVDPTWALHNATRRGQVTQLYPGTYVDSAQLARLSDLGRHVLRAKAALRYVGDGSALSHSTALALWQLRRQPAHEPIHVTVTPQVRKRGVRGIVIHQRRGFAPDSQLRRAGLAVTSVAHALVDSWPLLPDRDRTGLLVQVIEGRLATPAQVRECLKHVPKLASGPSLRRLLNLMSAGCRSPLELWGAMHVFTGPEFGKLRRQVPVKTATRLVYLDLYADEERVNFELNGAAWHGSTVQRERDLRRDAALAALGILVVRFSYARLTIEPEAVRREAAAVLAARRARR